ncbi:DNA-binding NarL/FixJ family response regulator [Actinoplanes campanulatus]|uniref:DNA-binding NarL/FixJ family response regulator n=1 Tax=Actinoplanes campanulatus TaxID=113559 RepID=A0A7W5AS19_9ACTN|nr:response regulator transcription factor [Actinoplanes campanulatus]MBB3101387.1 DNA-binding NarL/FixJ family response regulator [Actinoplanes campanulatus]GGN49611.1 DNA-binding response regulator [Actinoplanes campanulatus]GID42255.1 DNA-binding response regulator [Actinoplanes campanulatus]
MRIVLAEDSTLLREGLVRLLAEEGYDVVAAVPDADRLLAAVAEHRPGMVVTDVRMPPGGTDDGLRAAVEIRRRWPGTAVVVLSQYVEKRYAAHLLADRSDGVGYLLKDRVAHVGDFLDALERVAGGATALDPEVVQQLMSTTTHGDPLRALTPREREVLHEMAQGHTNASVAARLHISQSAVEKHVNTIFDRLGLSHVTGYSRRVLAILRYLGAG